MTVRKTLIATVGAAALVLSSVGAEADNNRRDRPIKVDLLASGLAGSIGGTVGPDGALYVPQFALGEITRIDPETGATTVFASGFPLPAIPGVPGGVFDVAFVGETAYALVTLVDAPQFLNDVGLPDTGTNGVYRIDDPSNPTLVADLGDFSRTNPPPPLFFYFLPEGVQYGLEPGAGGLLVSDGHHNRVLHVDLGGGTSVLKQYGNVVPSGLDVFRGQVFLAETGAIAGSPGAYTEVGEVTAFDLGDPTDAGPVAGGISMAVDVQSGPGRSLYALSQGTWNPDLDASAAGAPALPFTGQLLRINEGGATQVMVDGINLPTSLHFIGGTAYVVTLAGEVWKVRGLSGEGRN